MNRKYSITKPTREGRLPRRLREVRISILEAEEGYCVYVEDEDKEWSMGLDLTCGTFSLACLIADSLPEPIMRRELLALGFKVKQVDG